MRKIAAILILSLAAAAAWAGPAMYLRFSAEWSYLTNAFSDPLPVNASDSYLEDIEAEKIAELFIASFYGNTKKRLVDIGFSLRASLGSYDYFKTGLVFGIEAEPFVNIALTDYMYLSLGMKYDAHLIKFLDFTSSSIYEDGFIMMTAGGIVGIGFRFGGGDD